MTTIAAAEVLSRSSGAQPVLITVEHASERMPAGWAWSPKDLPLRGTHWAYDIGAEDLARALADALGSVAVFARFTRLLVDPNRPEASPDLVRAAAGQRSVHMNRGLSVEERARRVEALWRPYHVIVDREVANSPAPVLLAVHTFTPVFEGERRAVEVGVLFDAEEDLARRLRARLEAAGFVAGLNQPYSGKEGLIFSVDLHARHHGRRAIEIELRQDLAVDPAVRERVAEAVVDVLG